MNKFKKAVALFVTMFLLGAVGAVSVNVLQPKPAAAIARDFKNLCKSDRTTTVYFGFNGHGDADTLHPCDWSELSFVGSVWIPGGCKPYFNGVPVDVRRKKGHYYNLVFFRAVVGLDLRC